MMVSDEEKRWLVVGIAMNKVVAPVLRDFIKQGMDTHYANLDIYCSHLGAPCTLKTLTYHQVSIDPCFKHLKFQNVNNNLQLYGKHKNLYNYNINSSVDLAKPFVPDYLAEFSGFDESLDMSAILRLLGCNKPAPIFHSPIPLMSIQNSADDVRENVRNKWGHCNVTDWTEVLFNDCFSKLETLVRSLGLTGGIEKTSLDLLSDWLTKGCQLCMGHAVDQNLLSLVQQDVKELIKNYKKTEAEQSAIQESLAQQRTEQIEMQNIVTSIQSQQSSTRVQLQEHNELLEEMLEWKEQQTNEKQHIMAKLVSLEKTLSDELLIRVEGLEKRLAEADDKVEHLERGFAKRDDKMEQVEQGFAKTNDQMEELEQEFAKTEKKFEQLEEGFAKTDERVEQLERGFAKTDDKVEQLEQGFAKTDDKVEQLERGFAKADDKVGQLEHDFIKVEKDLSKTDDKVEQLEQGSAKTDNIVEQLERGFAKTGVKVGQLEHGLLKVGKDLSKTDDKVEQLEQGSAKTDNKVEQLQREFAKVENDVFETGNKVKQLEEEVTSQRMKENKPGSKTFLPRSNLPPKVPHFTGRQKECDEIVGHMTSESTRLVSVWGSPGFGKTSVAIAVGHHLQARELPVFFLSLRGLKSKSDLASKFLGLFRQTGTLETNKLQSLSTDDELCLIFDRLSDRCVIILDNADDLFECGVPNVKEEVINLIGEILNRSDKINFLLTTRESLSFLNLHFQGRMSVRIKELDKLSSQTLARELLPDVSFYHLTKVSQICGQVPLAIKLMCSSIPEDFARASQYIDEFLECTENIVEMLDNPDYPSNLRLKSLFQSSFQRLSTQDQEALVSLCILPDNFDFKIAAAVLGITRTTEVERVLQRLQRKSLIDCCSNSGKITTHKLIQSFAREKGENDMRETVLISKSRFYAFYIGLFEKLNENFLTGRSMSAFMEFFEDENNIVQSLIEGCCDSKTADRVFDVLTKAELFLDSLFWTGPPHKIFDSAIMAAKQSGKSVFYRRLLISYAFNYVTWGSGGSTKKLLSESKELQVSASSDSDGERGKYFCYFGIHECVIGKTETGVKALEKALSSLRTSPEHQILLLIVFQILAIYYQYKNDSMSSSKFYIKALKECRDAGDMGLLVIPTTTTATNEGGESNTPTTKANPLVNEPLQIHVIMLVREALGKFLTTDTKRFFGNLLLKIIKESVSELRSIRPGWLKFHGNAVNLLQGFGKYEDAITLTKEIASVHELALQQSMKRKEKVGESPENHEEAIARTYSDQGEIHYRNGNYAEALTSYKRALNTRLKLFSEEHSKTADSYRDLGLTHHSLGDYTSALQSHKRALNIRLKLFGEEHPKTADSYRNIGITHRSQGDYTSALESGKRALDIRIKLSGEENSRTADSYHSVGVTQHSLGDYTSALESHKCALDIRIKLFDELRTADSYHEIGVTQYSLGDYASALESHKRALDIRIKLFGEEHPKTAESYHSVGLAQHSLREYTSALESKKPCT